EVAVFDACSLCDRFALTVGQELDDRRLPLAAGDLDPGQTLGAVNGRERPEIVDLLARHRRAALDVDGLDLAAAVDGRAEYLEARRREHARQVDELHRKARVRAVGAVARDGFVPAHARERVGERTAE